MESKTNETSLAEEKFRLLVDSVRDYGIFILDPNGIIMSWNKGAERMKGYKAEEIIGKHFSIFYLSDDIQRNHPQFELEKAREEGRYEEEGWRLRKDGTRFWANIIINTLKDANGKHIGFAKVTRDLTERRAAEEKLRANEERTRKMFEGVKDYAMIMLKPDGTVSSWNEGARRIKGYEAAEVIGKYFSIFCPEQDIQMGKCEYELKEAAETGRFEDEGWRKRKDGTKFWAHVLITAIRDNAGELLGYTKVTRDVTDRKRADDLLKMAYTSLEKRVEERTRELMETNQKLQDAVQVRDEFLSIASHELRTPLTPLKMQIQSLLSTLRKKNYDALSDERIERMTDTCERAITRLSSLLENLLDVSRINLGKFALNYETVDLSEMGRIIIKRYENEISNSGSKITFISNSPAIGSFDQLRIEQVFVNLLMNAVKYGSKKPIDIEVKNVDSDIYLTFTDHGIGIPLSDHQRIFQRFERIDTHANIGGMGLGLFICQQIVEAHGGNISVTSIPFEGSTFTVKLPISRP